MYTEIALIVLKIPYFSLVEFDDREYNFDIDDMVPFIRPYLEEKFKSQGKSIDSITEKDVESLYRNIQQVWVVSKN